jgi:hypothetical protein
LPNYPYEAVVAGDWCYFTKDGCWLIGETTDIDLFLRAAKEPGAISTEGGDEPCRISTTPVSDRPAEVQPLSAGQRDPNNADEMKAANRQLEEWMAAYRGLMRSVIRGLGRPMEELMVMNEARVEQDITRLRAALTTAETHAKSLEGRVKELEEVGESALLALDLHIFEYNPNGADKMECRACGASVELWGNAPFGEAKGELKHEPDCAAERLRALLRPATAGPEVQG